MVFLVCRPVPKKLAHGIIGPYAKCGATSFNSGGGITIFLKNKRVGPNRYSISSNSRWSNTDISSCSSAHVVHAEHPP